MRALQIIIGYLCAILGSFIIVIIVRALATTAEIHFTFIGFINDVVGLFTSVLPVLILGTIIQFSIAIYFAEKHTIRFVTYYLLIGTAASISGITVILFLLSFLPYTGISEEQHSTIVVVYGLSYGVIAGFIYWLIAGRKAGGKEEDASKARQTEN
jgi:uncharacterized membrane protein